MRRVRGAILLPVLLLAGCPTKAKFDPDGGAKGDGSVDETPRLQITSPADGSYTNGGVTIVVVSLGDPAPSGISLFLDGGMTPLATQTAQAPYSFSWDTTAVPEGPHTIVAKAMAGAQPIASLPITVNVDRTAPRVTSTTPAAGATGVVLRSPIAIVFSEAIAAPSLTSLAATLTVGSSIVATTVTLGPDGRTATIAIDDPSSLSLPATLSVTLSRTITDLAGNALTLPTTAWSWSVPDWIKLSQAFGSGLPYPPSLAIGPNSLPVFSYVSVMGNAGGISGYLTQLALYDGAG